MSGEAQMPADALRSSSLLHTVLWGTTYLFLASTYFSIAVNSIALGCLATLWGVSMVTQKRWDVVRTPLDAVFLAYVLAQLLSTVLSVNPVESFVNSRRLLLIGIVYFFATHIVERRQLQRAVLVLLGTAVLVSILGVLKLIFGSPEETVRLGIFQFYMTTSGLMLIAGLLLIPFVVGRGTPGAVRWAALAALAPVLISLYATVTRGAYLAFVAGIVFIALVRNRKLLIPLALIVVLILLFAPPYVESRIGTLTDMSHPENQTRIMMWTSGIRIAADHPFVGVGDIDLGDLMRHYADPGYPGVWGHVHNILLQVLVTLGILGLIVVVTLFVKVILVEWRLYKEVRHDWFLGSVVLGALAVVVGIQVQGLTEWSYGDQEIAVLLWTTLGMALAAGRITVREQTIATQKAGGG